MPGAIKGSPWRGLDVHMLSKSTRTVRLATATSKTIVTGVILFFGLLSAARADITYTYTGNDFTIATSPYTKSDSVSGFFTLAAALGDNLSNSSLAPATYSFTDGVQTFTNSSPPATVTFDVSTDGSGNITNWDIFLQNTSGPFSQTNTVSTQNPGNGVIGAFPRDIANVPQGCCGESQGANSFDAGTWKASGGGTSTVPEPRTISWMLLGLLAGAGLVHSRPKIRKAQGHAL